MNDQLKIFSGRSNPALSKDIASYLGKDLGKLTIKTFSDGELWLQFEENIRGCDVFIIPVSYTHLTLPTNREV